MAQSCLPDGITFETQAQIDSFQVNYPGCTEVEGNVVGNEVAGTVAGVDWELLFEVRWTRLRQKCQKRQKRQKRH